MSRLRKISTFFKQNLLGLFIFALLSSVAATLLYERFISSPKEPDAKAKSKPETKSEIAMGGIRVRLAWVNELKSGPRTTKVSVVS